MERDGPRISFPAPRCFSTRCGRHLVRAGGHRHQCRKRNGCRDGASTHIYRRKDPVGGVAQAGCGSEEGRDGGQRGTEEDEGDEDISGESQHAQPRGRSRTRA